VSHVGRRVEGEIHPGVAGTVVNQNPSSGRWPRTEESFDILWDNGTCSRRVARTILEQEWSFRPEPRLSEAECRNRWFDLLVAMSKDLTARHAGRQSSRTPAALPQRLALPGFALDGGMEAVVHAHPLQTAPVPSAKLVREAAKALLEQRYPGTGFGMHCERRTLSVAWMDGPLGGSVWKVLSALVDQRAVTAVRVDRGLSEELVQSAVDYCLWRGCPDEAARDRAALRVHAQAFLDGTLELEHAESGPAAGLSFQSLVRCVLDRWDDSAQVFRSTRRTQGLVAEVAALFPNDEEAAEHFRLFRAAVASVGQQGRDAITYAAAARPVRERS
jgi:hypothetical protein